MIGILTERRLHSDIHVRSQFERPPCAPCHANIHARIVAFTLKRSYSWTRTRGNRTTMRWLTILCAGVIMCTAAAQSCQSQDGERVDPGTGIGFPIQQRFQEKTDVSGQAGWRAGDMD